jgi:uncharacterized membrane protein YfcA
MQCYDAMDLIDIVVLLGAGVFAGAVNAVAGGGSLITFPALLALGLGPVPANVTNSVAVTPGYFASVFGSRADLAEFATHAGGGGALWRLVPTAVIGSAVGCALLLATPERAFEVVVPFLVLGAAAMLAFQERLRALVGHPQQRPPQRSRTVLHLTVGLGAVYGGYFGAALGVMMVAALGLILPEPLRRINAIKNAFSAVVGIATIAVFAVFSPVEWSKAALLAPACLVGGYAGARLARRLPPRVLRGVIVVVGIAVGTVLLVKAH